MFGSRRAAGVLIALLAAVSFLFFTANGPTLASQAIAGGSAMSSTFAPTEDEQATQTAIVRTRQDRQDLPLPVPSLNTLALSIFTMAAALLAWSTLRPTVFPRGPDNLGRRKLILHGIHRC